MLSIIFGIMAALTWGGSDFAGGLSSRRISPYVAVLSADVIGGIFLIAAIPIVQEPFPSWDIILLCLSVGAVGSFSLMLLYQAMATGKMSIAIPISGLLAAIIPIIVGSFTEGMPGWLKFLGFALALAAVWLVSQEEGDGRPRIERLADLRLPFLAGLGFGLYFVFIHTATQTATLWPMIASRTGGVIIMTIFVLLRRESFKMKRKVWFLVCTCGCLDVSGNLFYILAGQTGRLDVAAVLGALYPGVTVFLAWLFLKEHISRSQRIGILATLGAITLMTI